jgi:putative NIF3 family GTP cyclohydrolase 1 type 2
MTHAHPLSISSVIKLIQQKTGVALGEGTVDTIKSGDPAQAVRGIVVTFLATQAVLKKAVELGSNLIITHEPTFYNHLDETAWLERDPVFDAKQKWIKEHGLVIWRFHDAPHRVRPDFIDEGMIEKLGWKADPTRKKVFAVPSATVRELAALCKERLGIAHVRVAGALDTPCHRVGMRAGACGGRAQIELFRDHDVDVVVCGESPEWETCEYVRDAVEMGRKKALIVLGHANSEEAGMEWIADWLRSFLPTEIPQHFVPARDPFCFV